MSQPAASKALKHAEHCEIPS
ncbi:hypothetical protein [Escherichia sp. 92.1228]